MFSTRGYSKDPFTHFESVRWDKLFHAGDIFTITRSQNNTNEKHAYSISFGYYEGPGSYWQSLLTQHSNSITPTFFKHFYFKKKTHLDIALNDFDHIIQLGSKSSSTHRSLDSPDMSNHRTLHILNHDFEIRETTLGTGWTEWPLFLIHSTQLYSHQAIRLYNCTQ